MSSAVGLRDQRISIYRRIDTGTDGFVVPAFTFVAERWGCLQESSVYSRISQAQVDMHFDGLLELDIAAEPDVPVAGIVTETGSGVWWWIRSIDGAPRTQRVCVGIDRISEEELAAFVAATAIVVGGQSGVAIIALVSTAAAIVVGGEAGVAIAAMLATVSALALGGQSGSAIDGVLASVCAIECGGESGSEGASQLTGAALITSGAESGASLAAQITSSAAIDGGGESGVYILMPNERVTDALDRRVTDDGNVRVVDP